ncbi:hypothetical protein [Corynebacterium kroppenstedtii]|uniref:PLAT domain-containing protein n=1 Tax=Corynebacterium kroppenstedtii TaxID=161879 RepID=A0A2W5SV77_9CORY|nr:hypothetical protein [Corynebacterium kroppenstedtii]MDU7287056.1 hypothetical protein [Corynebacterium kroppenstedtii]PZR03335.1 MAG: hypothetical protein DI525_10360 [Corynebacterium kroppenstedtii]
MFTTVAALSTPAFASATTPTTQIQIKAHAAGEQASLGAAGATAVASALATAEDDDSDGFIDVAITGDGSFSIAPGQMQITNGQGKAIASSTELTERNPDTNQYIRDIKSPETIEAGATKHFRFEFPGSDSLGDAGNLSVLNNSNGKMVAAWHIY